MIALAIPVGLLIGLSLGALGGGGSILTVPALVYLLGQDPRSATTGSLLIVGVTSMTSVLTHARAGHVRFARGAVFGVLGTAGSWAGSTLAASVPPDVLLAAFSVLLLAVAAVMVLRDRDEGSAAPTARPDETRRPVLTLRPRFRCDCATALKVLGTASAVGLLTGFFGVGGGFVVVPALVLVLGFSMPVAVGTSLLVIAVNSATALLSRAGQDISLDWAPVTAFTVAAVAGSLLGGQVTSRIRPQLLARAFTVLLVAVAGYTAARSLPQLL